MSSSERAEIIKDISGISTYEDNKNKALKELEQVNEKVKETNIVLRERQKHLDELKKEKRTAEQYKSTKEELRETKGRLVLKNLDIKRGELSDVGAKIEEQMENIRKKTDSTTELSLDIKKIDEDLSIINKSLGAAGAEKKNELDYKIKGIKDEINLIETNIASHINEIKRIKDRDANIASNILSSQAEAEKLRKDLEDYGAEIEKINDELKKYKADTGSSKEITF